MNAISRIASIALGATSFVSCKVGPEYVPPEPFAPAHWEELAAGLEAGNT